MLEWTIFVQIKKKKDDKEEENSFALIYQQKLLGLSIGPAESLYQLNRTFLPLRAMFPSLSTSQRWQVLCGH